MDKCYECGAQTKTVRGDYSYTESGLPVLLRNAELIRCPNCGDSVVIRNIDALHTAIAKAVLRKPARLTGAELSFLRKYLAKPSKTFATLLHVDPAAYSRWERGVHPIGEQSDFLIRFVASALSTKLRTLAPKIARELADITKEQKPKPLSADVRTMNVHYETVPMAPQA